MKTAPLFLVVAAFALNACTTLVNRRDTYRPAEGDGPYTRALDDGTWKNGVKPAKPKKSIAQPVAATPTV
ncbi:MAG: hypothetical protein V4710_10550 [Verrucomicrobiota bacterium]